MLGSLTEITLDGLEPVFRGKVRDVYDARDGQLVIVATDRISAYDCVLASGIPEKGAILTKLSAFWFEKVSGIVKTHFITCDTEKFPDPFRGYSSVLSGRAMLVVNAVRIDFECVVRGYLAGSAWQEYEQKGTIAGNALKRGMKQASKLETPLFTPAVKVASGHDENITFDFLERKLGPERAAELRRVSLEVYVFGAEYCEKKGIILADSKFEFGLVGNDLILIDELFSPDSSRFWPAEEYEPGKAQESFDKQFVRDYLDSIGWDRKPPAPTLPPDVVARTRQRYTEAMERICGPLE